MIISGKSYSSLPKDFVFSVLFQCQAIGRKHQVHAIG